MEKDLVETFLAVAEVKNISKASRLLYVSQATVSYRLKQLERQVGADLIARRQGARETSLTDSGRRLLPLAQSWLTANLALENFQPWRPAVQEQLSAKNKSSLVNAASVHKTAFFLLL